jgi:inhibitor of KinA
MTSMTTRFPYSFSPLGDQGILIDFGNRIDVAINETVLHLFDHFTNNPVEGIKGLVPAFSSLAVFYDIDHFWLTKERDKTIFDTVVEKLNARISKHHSFIKKQPVQHRIPFCPSEKFAWDLDEVMRQTRMTAVEFMEIFTAATYRVFMVGFLPGFAYMGELDERIAVPRKNEPRINIPRGSVGIAGRQTGIYPMDSPGGWQIIGRTPVPVFNKDEDDPAYFYPGDEVSFYLISEDEFEDRKRRHH